MRRGDPAMGKVLGAVEWQVQHFEDLPVLVVACLRRGRGAVAPAAPDRRHQLLRVDLPERPEPACWRRAPGLGASLITLPLLSAVAARRTLGLPMAVQPACIVPLGWPRAATARRPAARWATSSTSTDSATSPGSRAEEGSLMDTPSFGTCPDHVRPLRDRVYDFMTERVEPAEEALHRGDEESGALLRKLQQEAKDEALWALGHPTELGGGGLPFLDYVYVNEVQGRCEFGQIALGTYTLQDSLMLHKYASVEWRDRYLQPLVQSEISPSFAMTEPAVASSDPTQLQTRAVLDGDEWVINGRKWFTTGANRAAYTTVMCRTEDDDVSPYLAFSMIVVPTDTPATHIVRETPVLGIRGGHCEVEYRDVRVPAANLLGPRGHGFVIAQERLGPGRIFHCMRWLGQAQRAFDLLCRRLNERTAFGEPLAAKQLMQQHVFESYAEIQACRLLTLHAAHAIDRGDQARGRDRGHQGGRRPHAAQRDRPGHPGVRRRRPDRRHALSHMYRGPLRTDLRRTRRGARHHHGPPDPEGVPGRRSAGLGVRHPLRRGGRTPSLPLDGLLDGRWQAEVLAGRQTSSTRWTSPMALGSP